MFEKEILSKILIFLVSLSAGALMGGAFLHLLPEASEVIEADKLYLIVLIAFMFFFFMEKLLHWRHCHKTDCKIHTFGYMNSWVKHRQHLLHLKLCMMQLLLFLLGHDPP